jgi:hypothetical protein
MNAEKMGGAIEEQMSKEEFKRLSLEWTDLDNRYDALFQEFLDSPEVKTPEEILEFKAMSKKLYDLEARLFKVAEGKITLTD